jgi:hypothetical protein
MRHQKVRAVFDSQGPLSAAQLKYNVYIAIMTLPDSCSPKCYDIQVRIQ